MANLEVITTCRLIVQDEYDRFIMAIRPLSSKQRPGDLDFFGGKLEIGEDPILGLRREYFEETGKKVDPGKIQPYFEWTDVDGDRQFNRNYSTYAERASVDDIRHLTEHLAVVCVSRTTALGLTDSPAHQAAILRHK